MDTNGIGPRPDVTAVATAPRPTPGPVHVRFAEVMAKTVVGGAESAIRTLPGGPMMAVALRGAGASPSTMSLSRPFGGGNAALATPEGPGAGGTTGGIGGIGGVGGVGGTSGTGATGDGTIEGSLQQSQDMNLYYLQIQEEVNAQNRSFTALSNVLKAEHDTVKTAIGNVR
jgi:hypothetical protein